MSTIKATYLQHPSSSSANLTLASDGTVSGGSGLGGLVHIATETFSAVSSVSVDGVFTAEYENYQIILSPFQISSLDETRLRLRSSGTDDSSTNYYVQQISGSGSSANASQRISQTSLDLFAATASPTQWHRIHVFQPQTSNATSFEFTHLRGTTAPIVYLGAGVHDVSASFDGFSLIPDSPDTITGTIRVYGYANS